MFSAKKTIDKISSYFYNISVGCAIVTFFNYSNLSLYLTLFTFFCGVWLSLCIENYDDNNN